MVIFTFHGFFVSFRYIFLKANLDLPLELVNEHKHEDPHNKTLLQYLDGRPEPRTFDYFRKLNSSTILTLYDCYKIDVEMFGYNLNGLMEQSKPKIKTKKTNAASLNKKKKLTKKQKKNQKKLGLGYDPKTGYPVRQRR